MVASTVLSVLKHGSGTHATYHGRLGHGCVLMRVVASTGGTPVVRIGWCRSSVVEERPLCAHNTPSGVTSVGNARGLPDQGREFVTKTMLQWRLSPHAVQQKDNLQRICPTAEPNLISELASDDVAKSG